MGKLAEFVKSDGERIAKKRDARQKEIAEWKDAVTELFRQMDGWLAASDPDKRVLDWAAIDVPVNEPRLGEYTAPGRRVTLGDQTVRIIPRARHVATTVRPGPAADVVQATGLVELQEPGGLNYYVFRLPTGWYIQSVLRWNLDENRRVAEELAPDNFEEALLSLMR